MMIFHILLIWLALFFEQSLTLQWGHDYHSEISSSSVVTTLNYVPHSSTSSCEDEVTSSSNSLPTKLSPTFAYYQSSPSPISSEIGESLATAPPIYQYSTPDLSPSSTFVTSSIKSMSPCETSTSTVPPTSTSTTYSYAKPSSSATHTVSSSSDVSWSSDTCLPPITVISSVSIYDISSITVHHTLFITKVVSSPPITSILTTTLPPSFVCKAGTTHVTNFNYGNFTTTVSCCDHASKSTSKSYSCPSFCPATKDCTPTTIFRGQCSYTSRVLSTVTDCRPSTIYGSPSVITTTFPPVILPPTTVYSTITKPCPSSCTTTTVIPSTCPSITCQPPGETTSLVCTPTTKFPSSCMSSSTILTTSPTSCQTCTPVTVTASSCSASLSISTVLISSCKLNCRILKVPFLACVGCGSFERPRISTTFLAVTKAILTK